MSVISSPPHNRRDAIDNRVDGARAAIPDSGPPPSLPTPTCNGDLGLYLAGGQPDGRASFSKSLPHEATTGLPVQADFAALLAALRSGPSNAGPALDAVPPGANPGRKFVNPLAGFAFNLAGGTPAAYTMRPAPAYASDEIVLEIAENYWMALLRDVPFDQYATNPVAARAAEELNRLQLGLGGAAPLPTVGGVVTPGSLFRGVSVAGAGDSSELDGPYVSQFLLQDVPFGAQGYNQRNRTIFAGRDYLTTWDERLAVQNGAPRDFVASDFDPTLRYLRNGRDLSQWVHIDVLFQAYFNACLILLQKGPASALGVGLGAQKASTNPYRALFTRQDGFGTLGDPGILSLLCEVAAQALKAVWYQKWLVHLRLRPEAYGGRIHATLNLGQSLGLPADATTLQAVAEVQQRFGTALLPMAFPEGSPVHPAYGAGHATVAGACVTLLKALFDVEGVAYPSPKQVNADGTALLDYPGRLTLAGELNKLASNVAIGRNIAGVHWRSDGTDSLLLGQQVATDLLRHLSTTLVEPTVGGVRFSFLGFDGVRVSIP
jgi:hypothetical protein